MSETETDRHGTEVGHGTDGKDRSDGSNEGDEEEMSIAKADSMVPKTWDEICGMTEEDSLRL